MKKRLFICLLVVLMFTSLLVTGANADDGDTLEEAEEIYCDATIDSSNENGRWIYPDHPKNAEYAISIETHEISDVKPYVYDMNTGENIGTVDDGTKVQLRLNHSLVNKNDPSQKLLYIKTPTISGYILSEYVRTDYEAAPVISLSKDKINLESDISATRFNVGDMSSTVLSWDKIDCEYYCLSIYNVNTGTYAVESKAIDKDLTSFKIDRELVPEAGLYEIKLWGVLSETDGVQVITPPDSNVVTLETANNYYDTDWHYWSRAGTVANSSMKSSGCRIVAQSKLLVESGVIEPVLFDPDTYYFWMRDNSYLSGPIREAKSTGTGMIKFAEINGHKIERITDTDKNGNEILYYSYGSLKSPEARQEKVLELLRDGAYVILGCDGHHTYVLRDETLSSGKIMISDSGSDKANRNSKNSWSGTGESNIIKPYYGDSNRDRYAFNIYAYSVDGSYTGKSSGEHETSEIDSISLVAECPVEIRITYEDETLDSSNPGNALFGAAYVNGETKIFELDYHDDYEVEILGTGTGYMDLTVSYSRAGVTVDTRKFVDVPIIDSSYITFDSLDYTGKLVLSISEDSGNTSHISWSAGQNETVYASDDNNDNDDSGCITIPPITQLPDIEDEQAGSKELPFLDVSTGAWYYDSVVYVYDKGLMTGVTDSAFGPEATMTRAMFWTVLARMDGRVVDGGTPWYAKAQAWALDSGVSDGTDPNGTITREQFVTMLWRYAGTPSVPGSLAGYPDAASVSSWAADAMRWAVSRGIIEGGDGGMLSPAAPITRAQAATILMRYVEG